MAVTITVDELLAALRLGTTDAETAQATRLLAYATEAVEKHAPGEDVPVTIQNEAVVRLSGYLFDQPTAGRGAAYANALRNSGAAAILSPYRIHRAGSVEGAVAAQAAADEPDVDQIARDAAAANAAAMRLFRRLLRTSTRPPGTRRRRTRRRSPRYRRLLRTSTRPPGTRRRRTRRRSPRYRRLLRTSTRPPGTRRRRLRPRRMRAAAVRLLKWRRMNCTAPAPPHSLTRRRMPLTIRIGQIYRPMVPMLSAPTLARLRYSSTLNRDCETTPLRTPRCLLLSLS